MTDGNDCTKQALHECKRVMRRHRLPRVGREVRAGLAARGMKMSVWSARPSCRVVSTPLIPVLSLWLTWAKFIAAQLAGQEALPQSPGSLEKLDRHHQCSSEQETSSNLAHTSKGHLNPQNPDNTKKKYQKKQTEKKKNSNPPHYQNPSNAKQLTKPEKSQPNTTTEYKSTPHHTFGHFHLVQDLTFY